MYGEGEGFKGRNNMKVLAKTNKQTKKRNQCSFYIFERLDYFRTLSWVRAVGVGGFNSGRPAPPGDQGWAAR